MYFAPQAPSGAGCKTRLESRLKKRVTPILISWLVLRPNPQDVEFLYTGCDAINCWVEPRCTVESVEGQVVKLKQATGNTSCTYAPLV